MDARIERRVRAARGVERQRAGRERRAEQRLRLEQADERVGGRELRAVEQREPLLRLKRERLEPGRGERLGRRHDRDRRARPRPRRSSPRPYGRAARDRPTRRPSPATGTTGVTPRSSIGRDAVERLRPHAGRALREAAELQRHHEPRHGRGRRLADAGRMRQHDVALKLGEIGRVDPHAGELAEARVDSVDRLAPREDALDRRRARRDPVAAGRIERERRPAPDRAPVGRAAPRPGRRTTVIGLSRCARAAGLKPRR